MELGAGKRLTDGQAGCGRAAGAGGRQAGDAATRVVAGEAPCAVGKPGSTVVAAVSVRVPPCPSDVLCEQVSKTASPFPFRKVYVKL